MLFNVIKFPIFFNSDAQLNVGFIFMIFIYEAGQFD